MSRGGLSFAAGTGVRMAALAAALALAATPAAGQHHGHTPPAEDVEADTADDHAHHADPSASSPAPVDPAVNHLQHAGHAAARPPQPRQPPPVPAPTAADRAAAFPALARPMQHAGAINTFLRFDRLEAWQDDGHDGQAWEIGGWLGTDTDRLWLRSEGERVAGVTEAADVELLYGRSVSPWWDVVAGVRHDFQPGGSQTWAAFGVQGLAPWFVEMQATAYVSGDGQVAGEFEAEHQLRLTSRWILESQLEVALHAQDDRERGIGAGLSTAEAGLRLRYEITPRFAPYVGIAYERSFGDTARFRRADGGHDEDTRAVAGLRFWF